MHLKNTTDDDGLNKRLVTRLLKLSNMSPYVII